jgi:hypothetical protein
MGAMPTGTDAPLTSDLIERFNALMADVLACVTDAALKAAGVPWPLRLLLAPLMRRRLARWSGKFSTLMADARAGRMVEPAANVEVDSAAEHPQADDRRDATCVTDRVRPAFGRRQSAPAQPGDADVPERLVMSTGRGAQFVVGGDDWRVRTSPWTRGVRRGFDRAGRCLFPRRAPPYPDARRHTPTRGAASDCGPPAFFEASGQHSICARTSLRLRNELTWRSVRVGMSRKTFCDAVASMSMGWGIGRWSGGECMAKTAEKSDPKLWEKVKRRVTTGDKGGHPGQWSARKAQLATAAYKKSGGGYHGGKSADNHLATWTREDWGTKSGAASEATGERYLPARARAHLTDAEYRRTTAKKRADTRKGVQFSRQPADVARKTATDRETGRPLKAPPKPRGFAALSRAELLERARRARITGRSKMRKDELVAALRRR